MYAKERLFRRYLRYKIRRKIKARRWRWGLFWISFPLALIIFIIVWFSRNATTTTQNAETADALYLVEYVKDGDTIVCNIDGESVTVRLIGVDTPESVHSDESKNCPEGVEASEFTKQMLQGKMVSLEYDEDRQDDYGRDLAYVYLEDKTMYNIILLEKGYAKTMKIAPKDRYAWKFSAVELKAKMNNVGFWDSYFD